ncbi:cation:dicarboxylase symporter family transporter [Sphingomonas sp.]|uniref:dicarboxylate/amino acid:cation symporter n=1 Tax=Sphingomonas sp. TaxID=28214 RepID=UPI0025E7DF7D|nr:cation:dicarboxylase symporter family transporter [Sphingomonas sp.]
MSERAEASVAQPVQGRRSYWVLLSLVLGLGLGAGAARLGDGIREPMLQASGLVGGLWLNALKMTVIPLVVALLVVGIAKGAEAARAGRIAGRSVMWIVIVCTASAIFGMLMIQLLTGLFPLPQAAAQALQAGLAGLDQGAAAPQMPGIADFMRGIIPDNVIAAASNGDVLPLVVFTLFFALAITRIGQQGRRALLALFEAISDALLVIIGWVLWIAPVGVFALSFTVGASAGGAAFAGVLHYIVLVSAIGIAVTLVGYPIAILAGRIGLGTFAKSMIAPQSVAISTRSSLASLPAMLAAARLMGIRERVADVTLPIAVALFRGTGPAMNVAVAFYVAHWLGYEPSIGQVIAATAVGAVMSYAAISLPGEITFISSIAPIAMALGVPIAPLALLVAVEMIPDIVRTLGNVTLDVAVTAAVDRSTGDEAPEA